MAEPHYHFVTHWRVHGTPEAVYEILDDPADLPRWWPAVYLAVKPIEPGDAQGLGKVVELHTKGWLPYTLRWRLRAIKKKRPQRLVIEARGDLVGRGTWTLRGDGPCVAVTFDWQVAADKPLLRKFSWLLRPIFAANHHWAMSKGEESLRLELARRRAPTPAEAATVPAPPGPSAASGATLAVVLGGALLIAVAILYKVVQALTGG